MQEQLTVTELDEGFWLITDPGYAQPSHCYLLAGRDRAALIDTGLGMLDIRSTVSTLTNLDVVVLQTHAHPDHAGGSHRFDHVYAHPQAVKKLTTGWSNMELRFTLDRYYKDREFPEGVDAESFEIPPCDRVEALENRGFVDLGERQLDVFYTPGHSHDSLCILDLERGWLFTGDSVLKGRIAIEDSFAYRRSMLEIVKLAELSSSLYPGHGDTPIDPEIVRRIRRGFIDALADRTPSGFLAGFATFEFDDFGIMIPPRRRRVREV